MVFITLPLASWNTAGVGGLMRPNRPLPARNSEMGEPRPPVVGIYLGELPDGVGHRLRIVVVRQERTGEPEHVVRLGLGDREPALRKWTIVAGWHDQVLSA